MILYHGTNVDFVEIDLQKGLPGKDFGRGFYLTDSFECAVKTGANRVDRLGGRLTVKRYRIDEDKLSLQFRLFDKGLISLDAFVDGLQFSQLYTQYSFHTAKAVAQLKYDGDEPV